MAIATDKSAAVRKLAKALKLPANTRGFTLRVRYNDVVTLEVETLPDESLIYDAANVVTEYQMRLKAAK